MADGRYLTLYLSVCLCVPQPVVTLDGTLSFTFPKEGRHAVTLQASVGNTVLQDQMAVAVYGELWMCAPVSVSLNFLN